MLSYSSKLLKYSSKMSLLLPGAKSTRRNFHGLVSQQQLGTVWNGTSLCSSIGTRNLTSIITPHTTARNLPYHHIFSSSFANVTTTRGIHSSAYNSAYRESIENPSEYWLQWAKHLHWNKEPTQGYNPKTETWFDDGVINLCYNAVDVHVRNGKANQPAFIHESPVTNATESKTMTYGELLEKVQKLAWIMREKGVKTGDRVVIYMPMVLESAVAILACHRIGAIHSVVFGGFSSKELATRIVDCEPKMIISATCGFEPGERVINYKKLLDDALELANWKEKASCLILRRDVVFERYASEQKPVYSLDETGVATYDWEHEFERAHLFKDCVPVPSNHPSYILYTSGSTATPKGVVRNTGGHMTQLMASMKDIFNTSNDGVFWAASDIGWVVGISYCILAPLLHGNTSLIFEGKPVKTPDAKTYWRLIEKHKVETFFSSPTAFRAIKQEDPEGNGPKEFDLSSLKSIFVAGERCDVDTWKWLSDATQKPVIDNYWMTESGSPIIATCQGLEGKQGEELRSILKEGSAGTPVPGFNIHIKEKNEETGEVTSVPQGKEGHLLIKKPLPPGMLLGLWNNPDRYQKAYFSLTDGFFDTGDAGYVDEDGNLHVSQRTDDVIQVAAHRLSSSSMESSLTSIPDVAEAAVVAVADKLKGSIPVGLVILRKDSTLNEQQVEEAAIQQVRSDIGAVAAFKHCLVVSQLPKTRSGKLLRRSLRMILNGETIQNIPATIEDPAALDHVKEIATKRGFPLASSKSN